MRQKSSDLTIFFLSLLPGIVIAAGALGYQQLQSQAATTTTPVIEPASIPLTFGETSQVKVTYAAGSNSVSVGSVQVDYDPSRMIVQSCTVGPGLRGVGGMTPCLIGNTTVRGDFESINATGPKGAVILMVLTVKGKISGSTSLTLGDYEVVTETSSGVMEDSSGSGTHPTVTLRPTTTMGPTVTLRPTRTPTGAVPGGQNTKTPTKTPVVSPTPTQQNSPTTPTKTPVVSPTPTQPNSPVGQSTPTITPQPTVKIQFMGIKLGQFKSEQQFESFFETILKWFGL